MFRKVAVLAVLLTMTACTKKGDLSTPQGVLKEYVSRAFGMTKLSDVDGLLDLTTGQARGELERLKGDEELFKKTFIDEKNKFDSSIKIRDERKVGDDRYLITYELTYKNQSPEAMVEAEPPVIDGAPNKEGQPVKKEQTEDKITTKKQVVLTNDQGKWLISEVQTVKTFVEHTTEEKISAGPPPAKQ